MASEVCQDGPPVNPIPPAPPDLLTSIQPIRRQDLAGLIKAGVHTRYPQRQRGEKK